MIPFVSPLTTTQAHVTDEQRFKMVKEGDFCAKITIDNDKHALIDCYPPLSCTLAEDADPSAPDTLASHHVYWNWKVRPRKRAFLLGAFEPLKGDFVLGGEIAGNTRPETMLRINKLTLGLPQTS
ncbi:hypothetical protein QFC20_004847 [Naganishia adeliensis]|uniref:Uncharacterized protein n=1 Tax=Naganishia adeliensis TaxID=92952 RepID=A0ACC2VV72_9TREE|nr:hypothetical protein QFC20_004847 [Naganishia adeliensis]